MGMSGADLAYLQSRIRSMKMSRGKGGGSCEEMTTVHGEKFCCWM